MKTEMKNFLLALLLLFGPGSVLAQHVTTEVYKKTPTRDLTLRIYTPEGLTEKQRCAAILFFFGGGWSSRNLAQFAPHAEALSRRGMVCFVADYRVKTTDDVEPRVCLSDAKSALRYVRAHAERLHVDTNRIAASGGSAGGHLAAAACYCPGFDDPDDDLSVNCRPTALVLFYPVVDNSGKGYGYERIKSYFPAFSPIENIKDPVPTIFFVGSEDHLIPPALSREFQTRCQKAGGRCDLHIFEGKGHGFLNKEEDRARTLEMATDFLVSIGYADTMN